MNAPAFVNLLPDARRLMLDGVSLREVDDEGNIVARGAGVPGRAEASSLDVDLESGTIHLCVAFKGAHIATDVVLGEDFKLTPASEAALRAAMSSVS